MRSGPLQDVGFKWLSSKSTEREKERGVPLHSPILSTLSLNHPLLFLLSPSRLPFCLLWVRGGEN